jgi:hypothetical protein
MSVSVVQCPSCGSKNRADASWCAQCLEAFARPATTGPELRGVERDAIRTRARPGGLRSRGWTICLAALVGLWTLFHAYEDLSERRRFTAVSNSGVTDPAGFRFKDIDPSTGEPVRFDPCSPVSYVVNTTNAPPGAVEDVRAAVAKTSAATGVEFVFEGRTNEPVSIDRPLVQEERYGRRWSPILIAWSRQDPALFREHSAGVATNSYAANHAGRLVYVTGTVIMNASHELSPGFGAGRTWGKVILHELGHVIGLDHVDDPAEVMNPSLVSSPANWGVGDLAGLRKLGSLAGCVESPALPR